MNYVLKFKVKALNQFEKLSPAIAEQIFKKLESLLVNPHIPKNKLHGLTNKNLYKIKLRSSGYRLVYEVNDDEITVIVIAVGKRDNIYDRF